MRRNQGFMTILTSDARLNQQIPGLSRYVSEGLISCLKDTKKIIRINRDTMNFFADFVGDKNPIHKNPESARTTKFMGIEFTDTPVLGTLLAAINGGFALNSFEKYFPSGQRIIHQKISIKNPAYPMKNILLNVSDCEEKENGLILKTGGFDNKNLPFFESNVTIGPRYCKKPDLSDLGQLMISETYPVKSNKLKKFYDSIKTKKGERILGTFPSLFAGSTLLDFLLTKTGTTIGANLSMDFTSLSDARFEDVKINVFALRRIPAKPKHGFWTYKFRVCCNQTNYHGESEIVNYGEIIVATPEQVIKPQNQPSP